MLEIFKLRQVRLRQLVSVRREVGAPEPAPGEVDAAVERELETGSFPTIDPETREVGEVEPPDQS